MARRAFDHSELLADLCGLPEEFVTGISNIWKALRTPHQIDYLKFKAYCEKVTQLYYDHGLNWYPLCPSIHKVLSKYLADNFIISQE